MSFVDWLRKGFGYVLLSMGVSRPAAKAVPRPRQKPRHRIPMQNPHPTAKAMVRPTDIRPKIPPAAAVQKLPAGTKCQGTTSVVPQTSQMKLGFSPGAFLKARAPVQ